MRRLGIAAVVGVAGLAVAGCVGNTDPATNITNVSAKLNAHGRTNNGPAVWWWEYATAASALGTGSDLEVCGYPSEPDKRCGPAASPNDVPLSTTVTGLSPNTTYYFRACGQDQTQGSNPACGSTRSFKTLAGTSYALDRQWGGWGTGDGEFGSNYGPQDVATDTAGNVYVADTLNDRIQKFSSSGSFLTKWGSRGKGDGQFDSPGSVATDAAGNVYVADIGNHRIQKFSSSGSFITKWGSLGTGDGQFYGLDDHTTDPSGNVYVADHSVDANQIVTDYRIQKFSPSGRFITKWSSHLPNVPSGLATDAAGNVYVGDRDTGLIVKFSSTGNYITQWDSGSGTWDVATDSSGAVYATDCVSAPQPPWSVEFTDSVRRFSSSGSLITDWIIGRRSVHVWQSASCEPTGSESSSFDPAAEFVATDPFGSIYVTGPYGPIQKFKPTQ